MKRFILAFGTLALSTVLTGCGGGGNPPADGSNNPDEVQKYEQRRKEEREKAAPPKGASIIAPNLKLVTSNNGTGLRF